jgi:hypothetical protein
MAAGQAAVQTANQQLGALGQLGSLAGNTQANIQQGINSANAANAGIAQQKRSRTIRSCEASWNSRSYALAGRNSA